MSMLQPPGLGFTVLHQKVELDLDFATRRLRGKTEITINPLFKELRIIRLNCRQCKLKRLNVNGRGVSVKYNEPYSGYKLHGLSEVHQYHQLRQKIEPQLRNPPEEELLITLPKSLRIEEIDPFSAEAHNILLSRNNGSTKKESGDSSMLAGTPLSKPGDDQAARFTPLTIFIEFTTDNVRDGLHFVGLEDGDLRYPHAYTRNSMFPGAACALFPCVDDSSSRCTWEISIKYPRTLGDALGKAESQMNGIVNGLNGTQQPNGTQPSGGNQSEFSVGAEDQSLDMSVICSGDLTDEIIDPSNSRKKIASFIVATAMAPQHVGFAVGPFEHVNLSDLRETDEDDKLGSNAIRVHGFCLPGRADEVRNTCLPMAKAIDYFTMTFGSYPFSSYKLCFLDDQVDETVNLASMALCSNRLLFPEDIVDQMDNSTRALIHALASQWIGVNIIPREPTDLWAIVGISHFITDMFMKKLCGNNEYRYRQKRTADRICQLDVNRPSIHSMGALLSLDPTELEFLSLKAPLVLFILDRRLAKASGSSGLSRIISRIFLNAKVGDLPNGALTTAYFMRTCEKLGHAKLDVFFQQWVYGAGCPRFLITQRFNKKKLVVEMLIKQVQSDQALDRNLEVDYFMRDVKEELHNIYAGPVQPVFTGPMTIRIHEADGTPYEHIVEIKEANTKFEIPYNTKYKRLKRSRRQKERAAAAAGVEVSADVQDDVLLYCLGDVLQSEEEVADWRLADWTREDEERMSQESYEWIRMDADFEWIGKMIINMPGYMFLSQLQQDRDVVAQFESIQYIATQREHPLISTILVRTLMDRRYFHGIRTAAAEALVKNAKDELDWIGLFHLEKAFQELFCFPDSPMTRSNDFSDRAAYYIQCAIPKAISEVRDHGGKAPLRVKRFLYDKLKFNDNANNEYSDCYYVATLMSALAETLVTNVEPGGFNFSFEDDEDEEEKFKRDVVDEIERYRRMDEWISSYQNIYSTTALECKQRLAAAKIIDANPADYIQYVRYGTYDPLRLHAFNCLIQLGALKNAAVLQYFFFVLGSDPSPYVRENLVHLFGRALALIAIGETSQTQEKPQTDGLVIEQESSTEARQAELARTQTVPGALAALKTELGGSTTLQEALWHAITSPVVGLFEIRELLDLCAILYEPRTSLVVVLKYPRYWGVQHLGKGKLVFRQTNKPRTTPLSKLALPRAPAPPPQREDSAAMSTPKIVFKPKKPAAAPPSAPSPATAAPSTPSLDERRKLTIKLKLGSGSGSLGGGGGPSGSPL
ncbi:hypothetical protein L228DRAFT_242553 [Xylona heveae TC161]|uniref:Transcription initiation factor TFIID subunit 2 n=1 Tax=Xylona heveae (strain CBS 132557 / TC161) TaxID=1328760 RepID=A0A165JEJ2_XYLHT|nr:hypothetical protein L228DRAFT_242553 [Xylona heveae TC161]KZF26135.1 hypothetical protein L228DRAFT_242553 [Xylona heveae TC161]